MATVLRKNATPKHAPAPPLGSLQQSAGDLHAGAQSVDGSHGSTGSVAASATM